MKFANTVQYFRHSFLNDSKMALKFQQAWDSDEVKADSNGVSYVAFYDIDKQREELLRAMGKTVVITADEGEYVVKNETIKGDAGEDMMLKYTEERKAALGLPESMPNERLYTAITSKGLEFKSVILYRFASDNAVDLFRKIIDGGHFADDSELYRLAHFFTKLYIAISRAKQVLFILDDGKGYEKFWKYFTDKDSWKYFTDKLVTEKEYMKYIGPAVNGNIEDFKNLLDDNYNPKEYAGSLFKNALDNESKDTMNRARSAYMDAGCQDKAELCEAYMYKFDNKPAEAGQRFARLGLYSDAIDCYWNGQCWEDLLAAMQLHNSAADPVRQAIATFMADDKASVQTFVNKEWREHEADFQESITNEENREIWSKVLDKIADKAGKLEYMQITDAFLKNMDYLSVYFMWYKNGMCDLRGELYFRRAEFMNRDTDCLEPGFRKEEYQKAVRLWEKGGDRNGSRNYLLARKYISPSTSERIKWMYRLGETNGIMEKYGAPQDAGTLSDEAQDIIFSIMLGSRDYEKALAYPYPREKTVKWRRMYDADSMRFLSYMALDHLSFDFFSFMQARIQDEDTSVFDEKIPSEVFEAILTSDELDGLNRPLWVPFFTDLRNIYKERVIKADINRLSILEQLSKIILSNGWTDTELAACMTELLFDDDYDAVRTEHFLPALTRIFSLNLLSKSDFRFNARGGNRYLKNWCMASNKEINVIKDNIRTFVENYLNKVCSQNKVKGNAEYIKALLKAYEVAVKYAKVVNSDNGTDYASLDELASSADGVAFVPYYPQITALYRKYSRDFRNTELEKWAKGRILLNDFLNDSNLGTASINDFEEKLKESKLDIEDIIKDFSRDDAVAFINILCGRNSKYDKYYTLIAARLVYTKHIRRLHFNTGKVIDVLEKYSKMALNYIFRLKAIDETDVKLLAYVFEALGNNESAAESYDMLINKKKDVLEKMQKLNSYLKRRALYNYSFIKDEIFKEKQNEYDLLTSKEMLPRAYPKIDLDVDKKRNNIRFKTGAGSDSNNSAGTESDDKVFAGGDHAGEKQKREADGRKRTDRRPRIVRKPVPGTGGSDAEHAAHDTAVKIARNLKNSGMPDTEISKMTKLPLSEVRKLK